MCTDMTVWALIYFFIFEMRAVADLISSTIPSQYLRRKIVTKRIFVLYLVLSTVLSMAFHVIAALRMFHVVWAVDSKALKGVGTACRVLYLIMFIGISCEWSRLIILFINKKKERLESKHSNEDVS